MPSTPATPTPSVNPDGTVSAVVLGVTSPVSASRLLRLWLPASAWEMPYSGRFWMARCVEDTPEARRQDWSIYLRRPLLAAGIPTSTGPDSGQQIDLLVGSAQDPGTAWLLSRPLGSSVNLLGPFGQSFTIPSHCRTLLVLSLPEYLPIWLPAIHDLLDRGGRITIVTPRPATAERLLPILPLAVELRAAATEADWTHHLGETLRWADHLCASLSPDTYQALADQVRLSRFRLEPGFAHALVQADYGCGFGACLACVVSLPGGGMTRACLHGPIFPLERLTV